MTAGRMIPGFIHMNAALRSNEMPRCIEAPNGLYLFRGSGVRWHGATRKKHSAISIRHTLYCASATYLLASSIFIPSKTKENTAISLHFDESRIVIHLLRQLPFAKQLFDCIHDLSFGQLCGTCQDEFQNVNLTRLLAEFLRSVCWPASLV